MITLAPGPKGAWVTSEPARVTAVDPEAQTLTAVTPDGRQLQMGPDEIGADRLAHGYAITAHRSQGATVDVAHVLDDGGGRELAYVAMSRARHASHVYTAGGDLRDAAERLAWSWDQERREQWVSDRHRAAERIEALRAERRRLVATIPPDVSGAARPGPPGAGSARAGSRRPAGRRRPLAQHPGWRCVLPAPPCPVSAPPGAASRRGTAQGILGRRRARQEVEASLADGRGDASAPAPGVRAPRSRTSANSRPGSPTRPVSSKPRQQARAAFIDANPEVMDRIVELGRAVEIERAADRRSQDGRARRTLPPPSGWCSGLRTTQCAGALPAVRARHLRAEGASTGSR